tara:strand:+ start:279 stop:647 length:369 start_codon:yes stop_codon:yes gene_type:complete
MKLFEDLNNENFKLYAAKYYDNPSCLDVQDFYDDLAKFKYIIRLLRKYRETGIIQERLVLNHIISIYNVFDIYAANRMMFYRIESDLWPQIKTFLVYLNYVPENMYQDISIDVKIAKKLQAI